jgi:peptide/nickel transport system substrate-binding protein
VRVLKILSGAIDAQFRLVELRDQGLYVKGQQRGGYRLIRWAEATGGAPSILINWDVEDPVLRALFRDVRFRKALSLAIDREKCNQVAWRGLGRPQQATVSRQSWHFQTPEGKKVFEDWANSYAAFDLKRANAYLDAMGLTKRDKDGYRLRPDGQRLSLLYDLPPQNTSNPDTDSALIVTDGWRQLGIEVILKNWPAAVYTLRQKLGKYMISMHGEAEMDLFTYPDWVFPTTDVYWHGKIGKWYKTKGKEGEAPTGVMKELLDIYARILNEKDIQKAHRLVLEAVKIHTDRGLFALGTTADLPILIIAKNNFRNIPMDSRVMGPWAPSGPGTSYPETFFFSSRPEDQTPAASAPQLSERGDSVPARGEAGRAP